MTIPLDNQLTPCKTPSGTSRSTKGADDAEIAAEQKEKDAQGAGLSGRHAAGRGQVHRRKRTGGNSAGFDAHGLYPQGRQPPPAEGAAEIKPYHYRSTDGIDIYVGKNATQNDRLTGDARPNETWLHAKDMPGSHVIIRKEGEIPRQTLWKPRFLPRGTPRGRIPPAFRLTTRSAATSRSPAAPLPGMVIYTNQRTLFMTVSESDVRKIQLVEE